MYEIVLLQERDLLNQGQILKYFYLLDPSKISEELTDLSLPKNITDKQGIDIFFHTIFEKIYTFASIYNQYLNPTNIPYASFFGEPGYTSNSGVDFNAYMARLKHMRIFLKLSLRNQCITQGFFDSLSQKNSDDHVILSATNEKFLDSGYFENPEYNKEKIPSDSHRHQAYHSKFQSLKKLGTDSFSWKVLIDSSLGMNTYEMPDKGRFDFKVPFVYKYWIHSFFMETNTGILSRHIKGKPKDTAKIYKDIYGYFQLKENELQQPIDKFIFHAMKEYYLGFSTLSYINDLMGKIQNPSSSEDDYLKRYKGEILESILKKLSYCPMPYSRHLFLMYALEALHYNEDVECKFLSRSPDIMMSRSTMKTKLPEETLYARGLGLIPQYFNTLNKITLPILSCLWKIVLEKLIEDKELLLELYKTYIESHDKLLTADFAALSFEDMADCCCKKRMDLPQDEIDASFSLQILMEKLNSGNVKKQDVFLDNIFSRKGLSYLICDFLRMSQEHPESSDASQLFQTAKTGEEDELKLKYFRFNRAKNIFDFFSSKW